MFTFISTLLTVTVSDHRVVVHDKLYSLASSVAVAAYTSDNHLNANSWDQMRRHVTQCLIQI